MTKTQERVLEKIPLSELVRYTNKRRKKAVSEAGPFASLKKFSICPTCGGKCGVRELRRHRANGCPVVRRKKKAA